MCKLVAYLQNVTVSASINTLIAISIDRYVAICHDPLRCQSMSIFAVQRHIVIIWTLAIAVMLPTLVYQNQYVNEHYGVPMCGLTFPSEWAEQIFFCLVVLLCYALPLLFIVLSYCFIFQTVSNRHMIGEETAPRVTENYGVTRAKNNQRVLIHKSKVKVLRMVCIVVLVFFVSWGPLYLINGYINLFGYPRRGERLERFIFSMFPLAQWLGLANSAINPLIYAYFNKKFRHGFVSLVKTNRCCGMFGEDPAGSSRSRSSSIPLSTYLSRRFTIDQTAAIKATNGQPHDLL
ncbi:neuropeptide FF receptor 2-like [Tropilaelaps mercedesae]|uniref:Neuropeptide FF receptor 2-like n=1 Tax=Tropilaelaps mercedesae TaxID=418985 RepID=A0A1V9XUM7_9ACAR|nr:neuropeptide FF receptor 2-like [Tropilaelaps mercedesae]